MHKTLFSSLVGLFSSFVEDNPSVSKNLEYINSTLAEIQEKVLGEVQSYLPKYFETLASESGTSTNYV